MWRKSDERRVRRLFRTIQPEPVPDTLREGLQADVEARFVAPGIPRIGLFWCALRPKPLLAGAGAVLLAVLAGTLLTLPRSPNLFAAVLEAMAQVTSAHISGDLMEVWISTDLGVRIEDSGGVRVEGTNTTWQYYTRSNKVVVYDFGPGSGETAAHEMLAAMSGASLLADLAIGRAGDSSRVTDVLLDGTSAKRIELGGAGHRAAYWIDPLTMRIVASALINETDDRPEGTGTFRLHWDYDTPMDPALFTLEVPPDATVIDCRDLPLRNVIQRAKETLLNGPVHEQGKERQCPENQSAGPWYTSEAWYQYGVGVRREFGNRLVQGGNDLVRWHYTDTEGQIEDTYDPEFTKPGAWFWLHLREGVSFELDSKPQVIQEEKDGRSVAHLTLVHSYESVRNGGEGPEEPSSRQRLKHVFTFDLETERLTRQEWYVLRGGQWQQVAWEQIDYPDELPPGIFDFGPPPDARVDDLRKR